MYHITEAKLTLFLLSCIESMLFFLVERHFSSVKRLLFFRCPKPRVRGFSIGTRASRAVSFIIPTVVIASLCTVQANTKAIGTTQAQKERTKQWNNSTNQTWSSAWSNLESK